MKYTCHRQIHIVFSFTLNFSLRCSLLQSMEGICLLNLLLVSEFATDFVVLHQSSFSLSSSFSWLYML